MKLFVFFGRIVISVLVHNLTSFFINNLKFIFLIFFFNDSFSRSIFFHSCQKIDDILFLIFNMTIMVDDCNLYILAAGGEGA